MITLIWLVGIAATGYLLWSLEDEVETTIGDIILMAALIIFLWPGVLVIMGHCYWTDYLRQKVADFLNTKVKIKRGKTQGSENKQCSP